MKPSKLKELLKHAIRHRRNVLIVSPPGCGKTEITFQASAEENVPLLHSSPGVEDPTDTTGLPFIAPNNGKHAEFLPFGDMCQLLEADKRLVYFMDDLGQAPEAVQKGKMALLNPRYIKGKKISDEVVFIGATNRRMDKSGVTGIFEAVKNRFHAIVTLEPDLNDWVENYALPKGLPVEFIAHNRFRPEYISMTSWKPSPDMVNTATVRSITECGYWMLTNPPKDLEYEIYSGSAGEAYAADLLGFLKIFRSLPSIDLILMNPEKEKVPTDPATLYAVCAALTSKATAQTFGQIVKYANRMTPEFSVMLIRDITSKDRSLVNSRPFIDWSVKHSGVLI